MRNTESSPGAGLIQRVRRQGTVLYRFLRLLAAKFFADNCLLRASSLSFSTLLALVPLTAFVFALFTGFNVFSDVRAQLQELLIQILVPTRQQEIMSSIEQFIANSRALGTVGLLVFAVTSLILLHGITVNLNAVWGSSPLGGALRGFSVYLSVIVFGALLVAASFTFTRAMRTFFQEFPQFSGLLRLFIEIAPFFFIFLAIWLIISLVPSARVHLSSSLIGALSGTVLWEIARYLVVDGTNYMLRISVIYGSIAAIPIFLIWLSINWLIIFIAAEISYVHQHRDVEGLDQLLSRRDPGTHLLIGLRIYLFIARRFLEGREPPALREISLHFSVNLRDAEELLAKLERSELLIRTASGPRFVPRRELSSTPLSEVLQALMGRLPHNDASDPADEILSQSFAAGIDLHRDTTVAEVLNARD
jgi:membrane protein